MLSLRASEERGKAEFGWLSSRHSFSFGSYYDPEFMGFGPLRVINEDRVDPAQGFGAHGHRDMEIISYVLSGALEHRDSMGNGSVIRPGDVQRMSAGTGIVHSEMNASAEEGVHFLQIWIVPEEQGLRPSYEERSYASTERQDQLRLVGSRDGRDGSVTIHQDVDLYAALLAPGKRLEHVFATGRIGWLQLARGSLQLGDQTLEAGDGVAIGAGAALEIEAVEDAELLLFDMAP